MTRMKPRATIKVAGADGELVEVSDDRFKPPRASDISLEVDAILADRWLNCLHAELRTRRWSARGIAQLEPNGPSASWTVESPTDGDISIVWRRDGVGAMIVRGRALRSPDQRSFVVESLLNAVTERCERTDVGHHYTHTLLQYTGFPWRGELWLDDELCLSQPSIEDSTALSGPRIIQVDWMLPGIDRTHALQGVRSRLRELSGFLSVVLGSLIEPHRGSTRVWIAREADDGIWESVVETSDFYDRGSTKRMPVRGDMVPTPLTPVPRPCFANPHRGSEMEKLVPADIVSLWQSFNALDASARRQFRNVATLWQAARSHSPTYETTAFALLVVACEALKPRGPQFRDRNAYHVVQALFGDTRANSLQGGTISMLDVRDKHLHLAELFGREFRDIPDQADPSFLFLQSELFWVSQAAIVGWLQNGGHAPVPPRKPDLRLIDVI